MTDFKTTTIKVLTWQDEHEEPASHSSRKGNETRDQGSAWENCGKEVLQKDIEATDNSQQQSNNGSIRD